MKRQLLRLLLVLNLVLLVSLGAVWLAADGELRGVVWQPPAARLTDFSAQLPNIATPAPFDSGQFVAMLERPLFSPSRRPPPPPPPLQAATPEVPPDNFSTAVLRGIFNSGGRSGIIVRMAGKDSRVQLNQSIDGWMLTSVSDREARFENAGRSRVLQLLRADMAKAPGASAPAAAVAAGRQSFPFLPASIPNGQSGEAASPAETAQRSATVATPNAGADAADAAGAAGAAGAASNPGRAVFGGTRR